MKCKISSIVTTEYWYFYSLNLPMNNENTLHSFFEMFFLQFLDEIIMLHKNDRGAGFICSMWRSVTSKAAVIIAAEVVFNKLAVLIANP